MIGKLIAFAKKNIKLVLFAGDLFSLLAAFVAASYLKFDAPNMFDVWFETNMYYILTVDVLVTVLMFKVFKIYRIMWQFVVITDYLKLLKAFVISKIITSCCFSMSGQTCFLRLNIPVHSLHGCLFIHYCP